MADPQEHHQLCGDSLPRLCAYGRDLQLIKAQKLVSVVFPVVLPSFSCMSLLDGLVYIVQLANSNQIRGSIIRAATTAAKRN